MMNTQSEYYDDTFYNQISVWSNQSSQIIVPIIMELLSPKSVIDVGCGDGTWLEVFRDNGVKDFIGMDGEYVNENILKIPANRFIPHDLNKPIRIDRKFDLALSLEVAEHLDPQSSEIFVESLVSLSEIVVFSCAVPYQPGTHHINSKMPNYWVDLFARNDYILVNSLKFKVWNNPNVAFFYKQNILMFIARNKLQNSKRLTDEWQKYKDLPVNLIHPDLYQLVGKRLERLEKLADRKFVDILKSRLKARVDRMLGVGKKH